MDEREVISDLEYDKMIADHHATLEAMGVSPDEICNRCMSPIYDDRCYWPLRASGGYGAPYVRK